MLWEWHYLRNALERVLLEEYKGHSSRFSTIAQTGNNSNMAYIKTFLQLEYP